MAYVDKLHDGLKRAEHIKKWKVRTKRMTKRTGLSVAAFCRKYGLDNSLLCHQMAGRRSASWDAIRTVEKALENEGA